ncbi:UvrD-helicase domain-containing protein [Aliikangiella maris]|uniref:UvrD-helicase domain-containing protein n=2 Tax=Aliikangiella maris TaxID=3162458 RepID=A0ABV2BVX7_9GAMM
MSHSVVDQPTREALLDCTQSFIVQAPAGSGKTELLTQRILALLSIVEKPENILAITFTRKAAAEMRNRVMDALIMGQGSEPKAAHEKHRWQLAQRVLKRDQQKEWHLLENASRLNLMTIDSLSASLAGSLPLLSQTGALPQVAENAQIYYQMAADDLMQMLGDEEETEVSQALLTLLAHKDNNMAMVTGLIAQMLAKRLQWMSTVTQHSQSFNAAALLNSIQTIVEQKLTQLFSLLPTDILAELPDILYQVKQVLQAKQKDNKPNILKLSDNIEFLSPQFADLTLWKAVAELFLKATGKGEIYSQFNASNGFPLEKDARDAQQKLQFKTNKKNVTQIARQLTETEGLGELLQEVLLLPDEQAFYNNQATLQATIKVLPIAVALLKLKFSQYNVIDFTELSLASIDALGHDDMPSDIALALDYRLEHILIDEFQDTSTPQLALLKLLIAGWQPGEHRSLFLVGDPMQSIYRFRDANVGLFMQIRQHGIGDIKPEFKQLQVNFRSSNLIVNWVNQQFSSIMPRHDNMAMAAVSYAPSVAFNPEQSSHKVEVYLSTNALDAELQANKTIEIVQQHLAENQVAHSKKTLAILARSRTHLTEIVTLLNQNNIRFQAVEIAKLSQKMVVKDLTCLAFSLSDLYDELNWSACLRAPWFGLAADDIRLIFTTTEPYFPVLERIQMAQPQLSQLAQVRCERLLPILKVAIEQKARKPFRKWLAGCFQAVGGLAALDYESDLDDMQVCLDKLDELQLSGELNDRQQVLDALDRLFAAPDPKADNQIQVMTIHKSKGLEFDTVILPRLDAESRGRESALLKWTEMLDEQGEPHHLIAISKPTGEEHDAVYQYISYLDKEKSRFEEQRVLYVAATRAKSQLYLLGNVNSDENKGGYKKPVTGSFLSLFWSGVQENFKPIITHKDKTNAANRKIDDTDKSEQATDFQARWLKRVNLQQIAQLPVVKRQLALKTIENNPSKESASTNLIMQPDGKSINSQQPDESHKLSELASVIGSVLHRQLQWISERYEPQFLLPANWQEITENQLASRYIFRHQSELESAVEKVLSGVNNILNDKFGQLILAQHACAHAELTLHKKIDSGSYLTRIIDRTFVHDNVRWIIDYKSTQPESYESMAQFIEREKSQYLQQISDYFKMFAALEDRAIKAGLYFPLLPHFELMLQSE